MIDLTGSSLVSYILRLIRDVVEKNIRFRETLGTVTFSNNTSIEWNDAQVIIRSVSANGGRLSPDYFMCVQRGRAILAKVADKEGQFVEWIKEIDKTQQTPAAGVYYINVDYFDPQTRDIGLTCQQFKWLEGIIKDAEGSVVYFRPNIDITTVRMFDSTQISSPPLSPPVGVIQFVGFNQSMGAFAYLLTPVLQLTCISNGQPLIPLTDFWFERLESTVICQSTLGGQEILSIPHPYISVNFTDQDGYQLRQGIDFTFYGQNFIQLAAWSPAGSVITANVMAKLNPLTTNAMNPENVLQIALQADESIGQLLIHTTTGDYTNTVANPDGTVTIPILLQPGQWARWEVRIKTPQVKTSGKKWELNSLLIVDPQTITYSKLDQQGQAQPISAEFVITATAAQLQGLIQTSAGTPLLDNNNKQQYFLPGLWLAIGDQVVPGDQVAVIVSPTVTETYEVFGSKENINFTLEIKANDLQTASDLSETLKQQLLIMRRENTEADGLTIFEATREFQGQARDISGTASSYIYNLSISASADWKVYVPLITRLVQYEITAAPAMADFQGKLQLANRVNAFGSTQFVTSY